MSGYPFTHSSILFFPLYLNFFTINNTGKSQEKKNYPILYLMKSFNKAQPYSWIPFADLAPCAQNSKNHAIFLHSKLFFFILSENLSIHKYNCKVLLQEKYRTPVQLLGHPTRSQNLKEL